MDRNNLYNFKEAVEQAESIVFFGGAGVSTESGIPDFRSSQGVFNQDTGTQYAPETIISHSFAKKHPVLFFNFHFDKLVFPDVEPNLAHTFLVELENSGKEVTVVTQNIDDLHQKAGSSRVLELHGTVSDNYCLNCGRHYDLETTMSLRDGQGIPRCTHDGGIVRPAVVMYEEALDEEVLLDTVEAISYADLMIVAGTSLVVYPAASLVQYFRGTNLVAINKTPISVRQDALIFEDSVANVFGELQSLL
ncbi:MULTISPECIES: NAD-dependent protein deacylase [Aerococcus]|uniref:protein acetyllysine N-acetyltransferase n=2 Tax=Aerococcus TaxID=1375 RepID=A0A1E9PID6_9LACT|nr:MULTISPECIES: NAD-dependent protein deacylase [Aerococcus]MBU5611277.1 NAD-dependent protein deacylase [Aerococcus urinae]MCY3035107.1 NAD-dependent protein deacylase [Aerococcus mictus]MCY3065821.1 NAD-dependent protein deacylase [Aerococcus mictus]MCY3066422.1 NAD-dependent protein deacylase [Aerococcus mictus]MCY3071348.1 NAD-dependent protein deacylase [Aerococcus mictus]